MSMRYLSLCSGIEAASVAWRPLGWRYPPAAVGLAAGEEMTYFPGGSHSALSVVGS